MGEGSISSSVIYEGFLIKNTIEKMEINGKIYTNYLFNNISGF